MNSLLLTRRHLEDLDNRGRGCNLRILGLPEPVEQTQLEKNVVEFFNALLDRALETPVAMERLHHALRARPRENEPPRDVVCCLISFELKKRSRKKRTNEVGSPPYRTELQLFQDLSIIMLQKHRALRPLGDPSG